MHFCMNVLMGGRRYFELCISLIFKYANVDICQIGECVMILGNRRVGDLSKLSISNYVMWPRNLGVPRGTQSLGIIFRLYS